MKSNLFRINSLKAIAMLILSTFFAINVMAQTSVTITVNPLPEVGCDVTGDDLRPGGYICHGGSAVTFTLTNNTANGVAIELATAGWRVLNEDGSAIADGSLYGGTMDDPTITGASITFYNTTTESKKLKVRVDYQTDTDIACTGFLEYPITVIPKPGMEITGLTDGDEVCEGTSFDLNITFTAPAALPTGATIAWTAASEDGITATFSNASIVNPSVTFAFTDPKAAAAGDITITLAYTDEVNACTTFINETITVYPAPKITDEDAPEAICHDKEYTLVGTLSEGATFTSWSFAQVTSLDDLTPISTASGVNVAFEGNVATFTNTTNNEVYIQLIANYTSETCTDGTLPLEQIVTVYPSIKVALTQQNIEKCAGTAGDTEIVTLNLTITGGCPANNKYTVTFNYNDEKVSIENAVDKKLTIDKSDGEIGGAFVTVTVPTDATAYTIDITKVEESGTAACGCEWTVDPEPAQ